MPTKIKAAPGHRTYDWVQIQEDRNQGMKVADICAKYGCSDVAVYTRTVGPGKEPKKRPQSTLTRAEELAHVKSVDWTAAQNSRTEGMKAGELAEKYGVSISSIYKYTKKVKQPKKKVKLPKWASSIVPARKHHAIAEMVHATNGTANAHQLVKQALVSAIAEREKLNTLIEQLEAIQS